jgi:hypothetical protein
MKCRKIQQQLLNRSGTELPAAAAEHLRSCAECQQFAAAVAAVSRLAQQIEPPPQIDRQVLLAARQRCRSLSRLPQPSAALRLPGIHPAAWAGIAALLVVGFALLSFYRIHVTPQTTPAFYTENRWGNDNLEQELLVAAATIEMLQVSGKVGTGSNGDSNSLALGNSLAEPLQELYVEQAVIELEHHRLDACEM